MGALWNNFWWIFAPKNRFPICPDRFLICSDRSHVGSWGHLGAKTAPRRPKKPQEAPKTASKTDFGAILVYLWLIFFVVFWSVWGFISALVACCGVGLLPCWFLGLLVCWLVALLVFWFVGCLFVGCLAPESKARWRQARRAIR